MNRNEAEDCELHIFFNVRLKSTIMYLNFFGFFFFFSVP